MSSGTDALYGFAAHDPRRLSPQAIALQSRALPQNILAHLALAFVATSCLWTVYSHVRDGEAGPIAAARLSAPATIVTASVRRPSIHESFAALQETTVPRKSHANLFDARHLSVTPATLSGGKPAALAEHLTAPIRSAAARLLENVQPPAERQSVQIAKTVPMPAARPTTLASLQNPTAPAPAASAPAAATPKVMVEDKATVLALISSNKNSLFQKLFGKPKPTGPMLAYASTDGGVASDAQQTILFDGMPKYDQWTAVYDISAKKVYLPDGTELEAHSGLGKRMDDPRQVHVKMNGATPPHVYDLTMREALFHGDEALRMTPVGGNERIFGRTGLLAHSYLLGPRGDSNGCVSFKDYSAFVRAYKNGLIKRLVVVAKLA
jgi:hypothetical protein